MSRRLVLFLLAALLGTTYALWVREYPPLLAGVLGAAIGTLVWAIQRTLDQIRSSRK